MRNPSTLNAAGPVTMVSQARPKCCRGETDAPYRED
jgi:hypothetical protein